MISMMKNYPKHVVEEQKKGGQTCENDDDDVQMRVEKNCFCQQYNRESFDRLVIEIRVSKTSLYDVLQKKEEKGKEEILIRLTISVQRTIREEEEDEEERKRREKKKRKVSLLNEDSSTNNNNMLFFPRDRHSPQQFDYQ